jgi:hypothetical protein
MNNSPRTRFVAFRAKLEDDSRLGIGAAATRFSLKTLSRFMS